MGNLLDYIFNFVKKYTSKPIAFHVIKISRFIDFAFRSLMN